MALQLPHSTHLRRTAIAAVLGATLLAPAVAPAASPKSKGKRAQVKLPVIGQVSPMQAALGDQLTIRGRNFNAKKATTHVKFRAPDGRLFRAPATLATRKLVKVTIPETLSSAFAVQNGVRVATRFELVVFSPKPGKRFTKPVGSPVIGPKPPPPPPPPPPAPLDGDCDQDKVLDSVDGDDDNDLLADTDERALGLETCNADSDGDAVTDGYELRSARDLHGAAALPVREGRSYPNPLWRDATVDYDGDGLKLLDEHTLWRYELARTGRPASLDTLSYSDGTKHSIYALDAGRRVPSLAAAGYDRQADFRRWLDATGHGTVVIRGEERPLSLFDVNRDHEVSTERQPGYPRAEDLYYDRNRSGWLSDDERDEDADGLSNVDESHTRLAFRMNPEHWSLTYGLETKAKERPFPGAGHGSGVDYKRPQFDNPDADGDGIRDGADDEDFDDIPNLMELSRWAASGSLDYDEDEVPGEDGRPAFGRVNPFNPCLPDPRSRTCPTYLPAKDPWAPFDKSPDYFSFN